ncbi:MAG TPA: hypothetical protein VHU91_04035 [Mycobacteriales bacterium]|jgi:hypothetical protein|nr:hypothetical protein [Mycobacteriales bacterium]
MLKKILIWGGVAFLIFYVATRPSDASAGVHSLFGGLQTVGSGFGDFVSGLL